MVPISQDTPKVFPSAIGASHRVRSQKDIPRVREIVSGQRFIQQGLVLYDFACSHIFLGTDISSTCMNFKSGSPCKVTRQLADWGIVSRAFMTLLILPFQTWMKYAVRNLEKPGLPVVYPSYQPPMSGQKYVYDLSDLSVFFYSRE